MTVTKRARQYVADVLAGEVLVCRWTRMACERFVADEKRAKEDKDWPYRLDEDKAERAGRFLELLPHIKGKWARERLKLVLENWQCFVLLNVFGWVHRVSGLRRFRKASLYVARKNGKSILAAGIGNFMAWADGEPGAEVFAGASTEYQAWEVFGPARLMVDRSPELQSYCGVTVAAKSMFRSGDASKFVPVIGKPGDGASPHCAITDEFHEHNDSRQVDTFITGMGAREQPLLLITSTAGDDVEGPCYDDYRTVQRILEGAIEDDEHWGSIWSADPDDDWTQPEVLAKANPNMGVSVFADYLRARQKEAVENARHQFRFQIKHLNLWVSSRSAFYNLEEWKHLARELDDSHRGLPCWIGLDLASKVDVAAMQLLWKTETGWVTEGRYYLPEDRLDSPEGERYRAWAARGHLILTDGNIIDLQRIQDDLTEFTKSLDCRGIAYDPWQATQLAVNLQALGLPVVEWRQTVQNNSDPMKESEALIKAERIHHDGNPVMTWMMGNVVARYDAKDNIYPRKEREQDKIDGPVALIMALGLALRTPAKKRSKYETSDLVVL